MTVAKTATPKNLYLKLVEVAEAIDYIEKGGYNEAQRYNFVKAPDVARAVRVELAKQKIVALTSTKIVSVEPYQSARGGQMFLTTISGSVTFQDAESPDFVTVDAVAQGTDSGDKGVYKAITGLIKYALTSTFLIPNEADDPEVTRKDEIEPAKVNSVNTSTRPVKASPNYATEQDKVNFIAAAEAAGLKGKKISAFVGIVTGGKSRSELTRSDIDALTAKLGDEELVNTVLESTVDA